MHIDDYQFGSIIIDGKTYKKDLLIYPDSTIKTGWQRIEGHELAIDDLPDLLTIKPDIFIMGTGYYGVLKVLPETKEFFGDNNIELYIDKTGKAVELFNRFVLQKEKRLMAGFHLTC